MLDAFQWVSGCLPGGWAVRRGCVWPESGCMLLTCEQVLYLLFVSRNICELGKLIWRSLDKKNQKRYPSHIFFLPLGLCTSMTHLGIVTI